MSKSKDPYQLLKDLNLQAQPNNRGKLKIFFGYAAGVGKTYAMLKAAQKIKKEGYDVVVGYVEPHQRPETNALLTGLEMIPALVVSNRGVHTLEFDLDRALQRKPDIILVDELAHTNADGLRHKKRYQDVEELLEQGIDVYTTINVQHIESLNDKVSSITHIIVNERIPDKVFDNADQVEVIDIEVEELIERLKKGKIYQPQKVETALQHFFDKENLIALREIALRRTADRINQKVDSRINFISGEHILVCISASPSNAKVIRAAARMANAFHARLSALYVEGSNIMEEDETFKKNLRNNFRLAQSFNAEIAIVNGSDLPLQVAEYAKISGVSKIIIGRTKRKSSVFGYRLGFIDQLITLAPEIEIYVIPDNESKQYVHKFQLEIKEVVYMCMLLMICTLFAMFFNYLSSNNVSVVLCYVIGSILLGNQTHQKVYAVIYAIISVLLFNYFFIRPYYVFEIYEKSYFLSFILLVSVSLLIYRTTSLNKKKAQKAVKDAYLANALLNISHIFQKYEHNDAILPVVDFLTHTFKVAVAYYEKKENDMKLYTNDKHAFHFESREEAVLKWVINNKKRAGKTSDTLPAAKALYIPVVNEQQALGCFAFMGSKDELAEINDVVLLALIDQFSLRIAKEN